MSVIQHPLGSAAGRASRRWRSTPLLLAMLSSALACSDPAEPLPECGGDVELSVTSSSPFTFSWTPACALSALVVLDAGNAPVWNVQAPATSNSLGPDIRYGVVPKGAVQEGPLWELKSGFGYMVRVFRLETTPQDELISVQAGEASFHVN